MITKISESVRVGAQLMRYIFPTVIAVIIWTAAHCAAVEYQVGPGKQYGAIGQVPWETLEPGDSVFITWRPDPYREKWVINRKGSEQQPITVSGVAGPQGQLPVIDGVNATTRQALNYWNEERGLIKIGGSSIPVQDVSEGNYASHIIIENLDIRSARPPHTFTNDSGSQSNYASNAAAVFVELGTNITIRNCIIHDSGNGLFVSANGGNTREIMIEGNHIYDNGIDGSIYHHNTYTAAIGITYQYNLMSGLRAGALGNNLKDRSAGLVVRYNWIENGNRQLDLVDAEDTDVIVNNPAYRTTHVYGNILKEADGEGNSQLVHYGGDSGNLSIYRKGTLYFFNNTIISTRSGNTTLMRLSSNDEYAEVFNNILYATAAGSRFALLSSEGELKLRNNWLKDGWTISHSFFNGLLDDDNSAILGSTPGFSDEGAGDYHLGEDSPALDAGIAISAELSADHPLNRQYRYHRQIEERASAGEIDLGAFELISGIKGDIDGSGLVTLEDVIIGLQILTDGAPSNIAVTGDANGDNKLGLADVLYGLEAMAD